MLEADMPKDEYLKVGTEREGVRKAEGYSKDLKACPKLRELICTTVLHHDIEQIPTLDDLLPLISKTKF